MDTKGVVDAAATENDHRATRRTDVMRRADATELVSRSTKTHAGTDRRSKPRPRVSDIGQPVCTTRHCLANVISTSGRVLKPAVFQQSCLRGESKGRNSPQRMSALVVVRRKEG